MILWSWIFFPRSKVFERSGRRPSSDGQVPRGRSRAICIFHARRVRNLYYSCAISYVLRARSVVFYVRELCTICVLFVRDLCAICVSFCAPRAHDVLVGPGFEPLPMQHDLFTGPRFDSGAWSPVSGQ
jgi:hypothetical protein